MHGIAHTIQRATAVCLRVALAFVLACGLMPVVSFDAFAEESNEATEQTVADFLDVNTATGNASQAGDVLAAAQEIAAAGTVTGVEQVQTLKGGLTVAGYYQLTCDIESEKAIPIAAGEDETIVLDLCGYTLTVNGNDATCALDMSANEGTVVLLDSEELQAKHTTEKCTADEAGVVLKPSDATLIEEELLVACLGNEDEAETEAGALVLAGVSLGLASNASADVLEQAQQTTMVSVANGTVYAAERLLFASDVDNIATVSASEDALYFLEGFTTPNTVTVALDDPSDGDVIASFDGDAFTKDEASSLDVELVQTHGFEAVLNYSEAQFEASAVEVEESTATEAETSSSNAADSGSATTSTDSSEDATSDSSLSTLGTTLATQATGTCLNTAWAESGTSSEYVITAGGTYYLSGDLTTTSRLRIAASGAAVTINLQGYTFKNAGSAGVALQIDSAASVVVNGGGGTIQLAGSKPTNVIKFAGDELTLNDVTLTARTDDDAVSLSDLDATALRASAGCITATNCTFSIDLSNQGNATVTSANSSVKYGPSAVYLSSGVESGSFTNSTFIALNSEVIYDYETTYYTTGYAYGLYSATTGKVALDGCNISATSALGSAKGVVAKSVSVEGDGVTIELEASNYALGIVASVAQAATLAGPVEVTCTSSPTYEAALYSEVENAFIFNSGFSASDALGVWIGEADGVVNNDGAVIGTVSALLSSAARQAVADSLTNALGSSAACSVDISGVQLSFALDESKAPVQLISSDGTETRYASCAAALEAMAAGETLQLLADVDEITFSIGKKNYTYYIDVNGYSAAGLCITSNANVTLNSSTEGGAITGISSKGNAAVYSSGSGTLHITDVAIVASSATTAAYGIYLGSTAPLILENTTIAASSAVTRAQGIYTTSTKGGAIAITGGSITVRALASGVIVEGVRAASKSSAVSIAACPIQVQGVSSQARGIEFAYSLALTGEVDTTTVSVSTTQEVSNSGMAGVVATASDTSATLTDCSITMSGGGDAYPYWCVSNGGGTYDTAFSFSGTTELASDTNTAIQHYAYPLAFSDDFTFTQNQTQTQINTLKASNTLFAYANSEDVAKTVADYSVAYTRGAYAGCYACATSLASSAMLTWEGTGSIINTTTGSVYTSLENAISAASSGDTLRLDSDITTCASIEIPYTLTIDVNGYTLTNAAGGNAGGSDASAAAFVVSAGTLTMTNSATSGGLVITLGKTNDTTATTYRGFSVDGSAVLDVSDIDISVTYTGGSLSVEPALVLYGIYVESGQAVLEGTSQLTVTSAGASDTFGAAEVAGVYAASSAGSISVSQSAGVVVNNISAAVQSGSSDYPDTTASNNASSSYNVQMLELSLDEESELYEMIQEQFIEEAECDTATDSQGKLHSANIYYVTNMRLENGLQVWAYSDQVSDSNIGKLEYIVASHIFVRAPYNRENNAYGIYGASGYAGSADVQGSIEVTTGAGNAYGLYASEYDSWEYDTDTLVATCSDSPYVTLVSSSFDLHDYIDIDGISSAVAYPSNASMKDLRVTYGSAQALYDADSTTTTRALTESELYTLLYPATNESVAVTFSNSYDASGQALESTTVTADYGQTLAEAGCDVPTPETYTDSEGTTYYFVGWKLSGSDYIYDATQVYEAITMDSNVSGLTDGAVDYSAVYVPVEEGQHLVTFKVENTISAYAVSDGGSASYLTCNPSAGQGVPSKITSESGYSFTFAGWVEGDSDECLVQSDDVLYAALPASSENVTYTARFNQILTTVSVAFVTQKLSSGTLSSTTTTVSDVDWTQDIASYADAIAEVGSTINVEGTIYTLVGWAPRMSDVEALYTTSASLWANTSSRSDTSQYFFAVYQQSTQYVVVKFYASEDTLIATSAATAASTTIAKTFASTGLSTSDITPPDSTYTFRGWNTSPSATSILLSSVYTLYDVAGDATELSLYAIWTTQTYTVTFLNVDGSTIGSVSVAYGSTVEESNPGFSIEMSDALASVFQGWQTESGEVFSTSETLVYDDISVYAVFSSSTTTASTSESASDSTTTLSSSQSSSDAESTSAQSSSSNSVSTSALSTNSLSSNSLSTSALSLDTAALDSSETDLEESSSDEEEAADGLEASDNAQAASGSSLSGKQAGSGNDNVSSIITLIVLALVLVGVLVGIARWFLLRRKKEDDEVVVPEGVLAERVRF